MTDKELIKQEIERLKEHTAKCGYPGQGEFENGNREGRNWVCDKLLQFIESLPEESGCEVNFTTKNDDLEEEFHSWMRENCDDNGFFNQLELARHFAEWQKQSMKDALQTEYEKGRFDMRDEMMKDAVDGEYWDGSIYLDNRPTEYKDGDKVKIIIVKTEQQ